MASETEIGWTDSTFNPWIGCQKVSPGCDHCYAEAQNQRFSGGENWGPKAPRRLTKQPWKDVEKWQRQADKFLAEHGRNRRVMLGSLCDIFDNAVDLQWTHDALMLAGLCPDLQFQLVTKRGQNMPARVPDKWLEGKWPQNVGLLHSVVDQEEADRIVPLLLHYKAQCGIPWVGLSMEPLLGPVDISAWVKHLDWIIVGGESGKGARPMHPDWVRSLRNQCAASGTAFFFKQWGEWRPSWLEDSTHCVAPDGTFGDWDGSEPRRGVARVSNMARFGKSRAGRCIDGREHTEFPTQLRAG